MTVFPIFIPGVPIPQGSKVAGKRGKKVVLWDANASRLKPWRATMTAALTAWQATWSGAFEAYDGPIRIDVTFTVPRPKTVTRPLPSVPADLDKYLRALGDSLTDSGTVTDDSRITAWTARKRYGDTPGITIHDIREDTP